MSQSTTTKTKPAEKKADALAPMRGAIKAHPDALVDAPPLEPVKLTEAQKKAAERKAVEAYEEAARRKWQQVESLDKTDR